MAPTEFENKIKELFDAREIEPSADAWDKIATQLESSPAKKSLRPWHYWMAASVVFIVFMVGWSVRKSSQPDMEEIPMVEQQITPEPKSGKWAVPGIQKQTAISSAKEESGKSEDREIDMTDSKDQMSELAEVKEPSPAPDTALDDPVEIMLDEKIFELLAEVDKMEATKAVVTDAEVDSLLRAAQKALLTNKTLQEENRAKGASLLSEVEGELEESFRERVFDKLKQGFIKVRTAVADRNN